MWSREELKGRAKTAFQRNYWTTVVVSLVAAVAIGELSLRTEVNINDLPDRIREWGSTGEEGLFAALFALVMASLAGVAALLIKLFKIFVGNILQVGANRFYMENREFRSRVDTLFYGFRNGHYGNVALTMFLKDLFIALWTLLFVVPGIIKSYEYRMVPYILSENPGMHYRQAFDISRRMMDGQKMDTFIMDLSFFGWFLLAGITCNIVGIFYVNPYYDATNAELYAVFRAHAFHTGQLTEMDLPGYGGGSYYQM